MKTKEELLKEYQELRQAIDVDSRTATWRLADWLVKNTIKVEEEEEGSECSIPRGILTIRELATDDKGEFHQGRAQYLWRLRFVANKVKPSERLEDATVRVYSAVLPDVKNDVAEANRIISTSDEHKKLRTHVGHVMSEAALASDVRKRSSEARVSAVVTIMKELTAQEQLAVKEAMDPPRDKMDIPQAKVMTAWQDIQRHIHKGSNEFDVAFNIYEGNELSLKEQEFVTHSVDEAHRKLDRLTTPRGYSNKPVVIEAIH